MPLLKMPGLKPTTTVRPLDSQPGNHTQLSPEAILGLVFGLFMAVLAVASLWLSWAQARRQRMNSEYH